MGAFEDVLLRLKQRLGVATDKGVAAVLAMSPTAFNDRKRRGVFPVDKLRAAAQAHPEWGLDVDYVLTGRSQREDAFERRTRLLKAASSRAAALLMPEPETVLVRDILFAVDMDDAPLALKSIDAYVDRRRV